MVATAAADRDAFKEQVAAAAADRNGLEANRQGPWHKHRRPTQACQASLRCPAPRTAGTGYG